MAEKKNALVNETAIDADNAALTERLEDASARMAEVEQATAQVAREQKQRLAEQEQSSEQLQKQEQERKAQAQEAAKSAADRAAAVLDYTENYRQNQKIEKAARATVSKAKMERLAAEAEAKAKAEREAEEALQREREELMARRQRSSALLKKVENDAPEAEAEVAAPAPVAEPAKKPEPVAAPAPVAEEKPAEKSAPVAEESDSEYLDILSDAESTESEAPAAEDDGIEIVFAEDVPAEQAPAEEKPAEESAPAEEKPAEAEDNNGENEAEEPLTAAQIVDNDIERVMAAEKERLEREAEVAKAVDEAMIRVRLADMLPAHLIPESLRLNKPEVAEEKEPTLSELIGRIENAIGAAGKGGEDRIADILGRLEEMARRVEASVMQSATPAAAVKTEDGAQNAAAAAVGAAAVGAGAGATAEEASAVQMAESVAEADAASVLPEAFGAESFSKKELRRYLKGTKAEIAEKKKELKKIKREKGESKKDYQSRRLEQEAALLGTQFAAIALLSYKGHTDAAESFKKDAEAGIRNYNKDIAKYNRASKESCEPLPEGLTEQIAKEGRLPENLPFGSAATGLDAAAPAGGDANNEVAQSAPEQQNAELAAAGAALALGVSEADLQKQRKADLAQQGEALMKQKKEDRREQKRLRKEMQKEMLMHALLWNPVAASVIKDKAKSKAKDQAEQKTEAAQESAESMRAAANTEDRRARKAQKRARRAEKNAKRQQELMEGYAAALSGKERKKAAPTPYDPVSVRTGNGAALDAFRTAAAYDSFLADGAQRTAYYKNRLAMMDAKREENKLLAKSTKALPHEVKHEIAAAQSLELIKDEINLLCLLHRYPDEKTADRCQKKCDGDIRKYNRHAAKLDEKKLYCKPISRILPSQALRHGMDMPAGAWKQLDSALQRKDAAYKPSKEEIRASYASVIAQDEADREAIAAAAAGLTVAALRKETAASLKARAKVRAAIASAEAEYEKAAAERNALLSQCRALADSDKPKKKEIVSLTKRIDALDAKAATAAAKKEQLERAKLAAETAVTLSPAEKAELLTLALTVSEKGGESRAAERLERITAAAAEAEAKAAAKANKTNRKKEKKWRKSLAAVEAEALAAEDAADAAGEKASRLSEEHVSSRALSAAYEEALVEDSKAEEARRIAEVVREHREADEAEADSSRDANAAMAAMALSVQSQRRGKRTSIPKDKAARLNAAIAAAEREYSDAKKAYNEAAEAVKDTEANGASAAEREIARRNSVATKAAALRAGQKRDTLVKAKDTAENATALSKKEKAALIALALAASQKGDERSLSRLQKKVDAAVEKEKLAAVKAEQKASRIRDRLDKSFAAAEAQALVSEGNAQAARERAEVLREQKRDKKALNKAYEQALLEEANAEQAKKDAEAARAASAEQESFEKKEEKRAKKAAMLAAAATLSKKPTRADKKKAKADRKAARKAAKKAATENLTAEELEAYALACEEKAAASEKQALLLALNKGRKKEKLKAYEAAVIERFEATKAREAADAANAAEMEAVAEQENEQTLSLKAQKAADKAALAQETQKMREKAKADKRAEAESRSLLRRQSKEERKAARLEKRKDKDEEAWRLLTERDEALMRRDAYRAMLAQEAQDKARLAEKKEADRKAAAEAAKAAREDAKASAAQEKAEKKGKKEKLAEGEKNLSALTKGALKKKLKAFEKQDLKTLEARYDAAIANLLREMEVGLCDVSLTPPMRKYLKKETAKKIRKLKARRRLALLAERADNKRYFAALLAKLAPKNAKTGRTEIAEMRESIFALLAERDRENERLLAIYLGEDGKKARTPWHKAYLREKKRRQRKSRKTIALIRDLNLSRADKKKLLVSVDRVATAYADIAEAKCRARKQKLKGIALRRHKQEIVEMEYELKRARKSLKKKLRGALEKEDRRNLYKTSFISLIILAVLVVAGVLLWGAFGDTVWAYLDANFPTVTMQLK